MSCFVFIPGPPPTSDPGLIALSLHPPAFADEYRPLIKQSYFPSCGSPLHACFLSQAKRQAAYLDRLSPVYAPVLYTLAVVFPSNQTSGCSLYTGFCGVLAVSLARSGVASAWPSGTPVPRLSSTMTYGTQHAVLSRVFPGTFNMQDLRQKNLTLLLFLFFPGISLFSGFFFCLTFLICKILDKKICILSRCTSNMQDL